MAVLRNLDIEMRDELWRLEKVSECLLFARKLALLPVIDDLDCAAYFLKRATMLDPDNQEVMELLDKTIKEIDRRFDAGDERGTICHQIGGMESPSPYVRAMEAAGITATTKKGETRMTFDSIDMLKSSGFSGFKKVGDLFVDCSSVPNERGNYLVLYAGNKRPEFLAKGVGGFFKGKNPNVSTSELASNWVDGTIVIYIGQAGGIRGGKWSDATLNERITTYMKFGQGRDIGHRGGRYVWQIKDHRELILCWKSWPNKSKDPKQVEGEWIQEFKNKYGKRPFANLQD